MTARLPGAVWRPVSYRAEAPVFTAPLLGWILHVVEGNGSPLPYWESLKSPNRAFAHAWVAKDGSSEQYQELDRQCWAQGAGNGTYLAFETEGRSGEPLTSAQVATLAAWHRYLGTRDALADAPGQLGIGVHYMGGQAWGGHTCPDPAPGVGPRSLQRTSILAAAQQLPGDGMTPEEILKTLAEWDVSALCGEPAGTLNFQVAFSRIYKRTKALQLASGIGGTEDSGS